MSARLGQLPLPPERFLAEPFDSLHPLSAEPVGPPVRAGGLITQDSGMRRVIALARKVAASDLPVLIIGDTGTGKELMARLIHDNSRRADRSFVAHNCSAIPLSLLESELFGYHSGAFTGAGRARRGVFDIAERGTVFLDEVAELALEAQPKLLRVLQGGEVWPLGAERPHRVDVRIVAATNRDLEIEINTGGFRRDLFYRLAIFPIRLPTLCERPGDIPLLLEHFVAEYGARVGRGEPPRLAPAVVDLLSGWPFPGNVRELESRVARAMVLLDHDDVLLPEHFSDLPVSGPTRRTFHEQVLAFKAGLLSEALARHGSAIAASRTLAMSLRNFKRLHQKLNLSARKPASDARPTWPAGRAGDDSGASRRFSSPGGAGDDLASSLLHPLIGRGDRRTSPTGGLP